MFIAQIRNDLRLWWELCENGKTAAEKVIRPAVASMHDQLAALEAKVATITVEEARRLLEHLKTVEGFDTTQLTNAINTADKAAADLAADAAKRAQAAPVNPGGSVPAGVDGRRRKRNGGAQPAIEAAVADAVKPGDSGSPAAS